MNSLILTSLASFCKGFAALFKKSGVYALFMKIYGAVSRSWNNSAIVRWLRKDERSEVMSSAAGKIFGSPFVFMDFLKRKLGGFIETNIKSSFICEWSRMYVQNFMAVNSKFFGIMLLCASVGYTAVIFLRTGSFSKIVLDAAVVGAIAWLINYNLMVFLNTSKVVDFIKNAAGFKKLDFEFYNERYTRGAGRLLIAAAVGLLTGAVMSVSALYGAAVPFALFGILIVMYAPITGVFVSMFLAPFVPTMMLAGMCIWTMLSLAVKSLTDKSFKWRFDGVGLGIMLLLTILFISSAMSFARLGSLKVWAMYFVFLNYYFVIINTVKTKEQLYALLKVFVISAAFVALYGLLQYIFGWTTSNAWIDEAMFEDSTMRVYSTLGNPNVLGEYLLLVLPPAAVYVLKYKFRELPKYVYAAIFLLLAVCLILTQSRGCWIGFMLSVFIFVTFYEGKVWGIIPILLCILPFVVPETIVDRILSIGNMEDSSTSYRVYIWMGTLGLLKFFWIGGIGMGEQAFAKVYPFFSYNAIVAPHSHNTFLQLTVEAGIGALIVFIVTNIVFAKKMSDTYRLGEKKSMDSAMSLAIASGVIGFLAQSMFDYTFYNYRVMAVMFMVLGAGMALYHLKREEIA
ncbi:MAG: O-antigen ligase family protein [Oscillospiraceae bacterium]|nr:O-antigen ligase family protein [Oscillospiraceae bacterium]